MTASTTTATTATAATATTTTTQTNRWRELKSWARFHHGGVASPISEPISAVRVSQLVPSSCLYVVYPCSYGSHIHNVMHVQWKPTWPLSLNNKIGRKRGCLRHCNSVLGNTFPPKCRFRRCPFPPSSRVSRGEPSTRPRLTLNQKGERIPKQFCVRIAMISLVRMWRKPVAAQHSMRIYVYIFYVIYRYSYQ